MSVCMCVCSDDADISQVLVVRSKLRLLDLETLILKRKKKNKLTAAVSRQYSVAGSEIIIIFIVYNINHKENTHETRLWLIIRAVRSLQ